MWDHALFGIASRVTTPTSSKLIDDPKYAAQAGFDNNYNQAGPLTGFGYLSFEKIPQNYRRNFSQATQDALSRFPPDMRETEYLGGHAYMGYNTNYMAADPHDGYNYAPIDSCLVAPVSRRNITTKFHRRNGLVHYQH